MSNRTTSSSALIDAVAIEDADLVVVLGHGFQPAIEKAAERRPRGSTVVVLDEVGKGSDDPHVWLDPSLMPVDAVVAALRAVDGAHAELFTSNAREYSKVLMSLIERFDDGLASCERRVVVTAHDAFGRLASR